MSTEIRKLTIADYDDIIELWGITGLPVKLNGRDGKALMQIEMTHDYCAFMGMYEDTKMIGVVIANYDGRRGWINRLAIDPDYRGKKLAAQLITKAEEFLYSIGAKVICALIDEMNEPSISCFQEAGYDLNKEIQYFAKRPSVDM